MKVKIENARCQGHARCVAKGPDFYELDDDGYCITTDREVPAALEAQARAGADACPERIITIVED